MSQGVHENIFRGNTSFPKGILTHHGNEYDPKPYSLLDGSDPGDSAPLIHSCTSAPTSRSGQRSEFVPSFVFPYFSSKNYS